MTTANSQHIAPTAPDYREYDTHNNYPEGVILRPVFRVAGAARTSDGKWADVHPPNSRNLLKGAHGVRFWIEDERAAMLEGIYQDDLAFWADEN